MVKDIFIYIGIIYCGIGFIIWLSMVLFPLGKHYTKEDRQQAKGFLPFIIMLIGWVFIVRAPFKK